jgi:hypothetical protein
MFSRAGWGINSGSDHNLVIASVRAQENRRSSIIGLVGIFALNSVQVRSNVEAGQNTIELVGGHGNGESQDIGSCRARFAPPAST